MIRFELNNSDWTTSKRYWHELKKQFTKPNDVKKADFINDTLFESSSRNAGTPPDSSTTTTHTIIPSINSMTEIMSEIDKEIQNDEKHDSGNDIDIDVKTSATTGAKLETQANKDLRQFIRNPV